MSKIRLDATSEQNILNMLLDRSVINDNQLSKINSTSDEVGKTKLETAIELNLVNEEKIISFFNDINFLSISIIFFKS